MGKVKVYIVFPPAVFLLFVLFNYLKVGVPDLIVMDNVLLALLFYMS